MARARIPANLPDLVSKAFHSARDTGDVHFFPTQVTLVNVNSLPFQLRFSPSLANKPRNPQPVRTPGQPKEPNDASNPPKKPFFDPFDNPQSPMLITAIPPSHNLVLNKFAIVPEHFILATQAYREQTDLLERADLEVAYGCIEAYHEHKQATTTQEGGDKDKGSELFVFYNSGAESGSSQPHRHLQLLPVERMREGLEGKDYRAWDVLAASLLDEDVRKQVPFATFAERIGPGTDLWGVYLRLYQEACHAVLGDSAKSGVVEMSGPAKIQYNLAMTRDVMVVAPRVAESRAVSRVSADGRREEVGRLALNGTVLAGTALVKTQEEWDALRAKPEQLKRVLQGIGVAL
ncbi:histidine triad-like protein [Dichotomopilus funicola]|uniref:Histidine triad-like protein n=1 Tax=Dichotomopilus funicola TaxID=1934379 RepID=A0AAN6ZM94_9PEZI|nr:histidine triad-like protein [Dichotomopilus funicola]